MESAEEQEREYETFETQGETEVRRALDEGGMPGPSAVAARSWLRQKEAARKTDSEAEQLKIALSAKASALEAAKSARHAASDAVAASEMVQKANRTATIAAVLAAIALILSLIAMFGSHAS